MRCIVTAGPTYEPLDQVRRLTNFSTGRLGTELANFLTDAGHEVTLLLGEQATYRGTARKAAVHSFSTTEDLRRQLHSLRAPFVQAVFHAAAVSDFTFGKVWQRSSSGALQEVQSGKFSSREEGLLVELRPAPKLIATLRDWFPQAWLVGWKYEVDGDRDSVLTKAARQIAENQLNACVANGPAFGLGFGLVTGSDSCQELATDQELFGRLLESWMEVAGRQT